MPEIERFMFFENAPAMKDERKLAAHDDHKGNWTIGYGTLLEYEASIRDDFEDICGEGSYEKAMNRWGPPF